VSDNFQLRKQQTEIEDISIKIKREEELLGGLDVNNLTTERSQLEREYKKLTDEVCFFHGIIC